MLLNYGRRSRPEIILINPAQMTMTIERALKKRAFTLLNTNIPKTVPANRAGANEIAVIIVSVCTLSNNDNAIREKNPRNVR